MPSKYPYSFRDGAMRMVVDRMEADEDLTRYQAIREIAPKLNIWAASLRHSLAVQTDGTVLAARDNRYGQCRIGVDVRARVRPDALP